MVFVQCKVASTRDAVTSIATKESIEKELTKTLVELQPPAAAAAAADSDNVVKPYFAIVQHSVPPNGDETFRDGMNSHSLASVHGNGWLVSASEPSPLLPGLCIATDVVPGTEYPACHDIRTT